MLDNILLTDEDEAILNEVWAHLGPQFQAEDVLRQTTSWYVEALATRRPDLRRTARAHLTALEAQSGRVLALPVVAAARAFLRAHSGEDAALAAQLDALTETVRAARDVVRRRHRTTDRRRQRATKKASQTARDAVS